MAATRRLESLGSLSKLPTWKGGHGQSATSADVGRGTVFVVDRTTRRLVALPADGKGTPAEASLASGPDYVRWVEPTGEVWVTEPDAEAIEIFRFDPKAQPALVQSGRIAIADGPESLVVDPEHGRAFTNTWHDRTLGIALRERSVTGRWSNGCKGARGLDMDRARGLLMVGCAEGAVTVIDTSDKGRVAGHASTGAGVDIVAYVASTHRLYVPAGKAATLEAFEVQADGSLRSLWRRPAVPEAHCVARGRRRPRRRVRSARRTGPGLRGRGGSLAVTRPRAALVVLFTLLLAPRARAYRPFDQTDADVAPLHVVELEIGPLQFERTAGRTGWVPTFIFNFGAIPGWELVVEADASGTVAGPREPGEVFQLETSVSSRASCGEESLQDGSGLSIAVEPEVLLPATAGPSGSGSRRVSSSRSAGRAHPAPESRSGVEPGPQHRGRAGSSPRVPDDWTVRPGGRGVRRGRAVVPGLTSSFLGGLIWRMSPAVSRMPRCGWERVRAPAWSSCEWA
jgi:hypothetical protein